MNDITLDEIILNHLYDIINNKICMININSDYDIPIYNSNRDKIQLKNKTILVIAGGGIKGLAMLGSIKCLYENNILNKIIKYAGTSIGGLICGLLYIGYTPNELYKFFYNLDFIKLYKSCFNNLIETYGLDDGNRMYNMITKLLNAKGYNENTTFNDLFIKTNKKLYITGTCLNDTSAHYFSVDFTPNMPLIIALRITMSLPIYFSPVEYNGKLYIDGGCVDNYPINLFKSEIHNVLGIYAQTNYIYYEKITNFEEYLESIINSFSFSTIFLINNNYKKNTIIIKLDNINIMNLEITKEIKEQLFKIGYDVIHNLF
jgi:predicted acylesterase/phospholipase RssA